MCNVYGMLVPVRAHVCTCVCTCVHVCMGPLCLHPRVHVCTCVFTTYSGLRVHTCVRVCTRYSGLHTHVNVCKHVCVCTPLKQDVPRPLRHLFQCVPSTEFSAGSAGAASMIERGPPGACAQNWLGPFHHPGPPTFSP